MFTVRSTLMWAVLTGSTDWDPYPVRRGCCIIVTWWSGSDGIQAWSGFLQCFDTVGLVIWPVKIVPEMTYYVSSGTLNPTNSLTHRGPICHCVQGCTSQLTCPSPSTASTCSNIMFNFSCCVVWTLWFILQSIMMINYRSLQLGIHQYITITIFCVGIRSRKYLEILKSLAKT